MKTILAGGFALAVIVGAAGCGSDPAPATQSTSTAAATGATPAAAPVSAPPADPYQVYLTLAPADAPELTADDAQTRAMLGCGTAWAPGTVDAALQQAYAALIEQWKQQGICG